MAVSPHTPLLVLQLVVLLASKQSHENVLLILEALLLARRSLLQRPAPSAPVLRVHPPLVHAQPSQHAPPMFVSHPAPHSAHILVALVGSRPLQGTALSIQTVLQGVLEPLLT